MSRSQHDDADEVDVPRQLVTMTMTVCVEERALEHDAERLCEDTAIPSTKGDGMCGDGLSEMHVGVVERNSGDHSGH